MEAPIMMKQLSEISIEEEKTMDTASWSSGGSNSGKLSAHATPFQPYYYEKDPINIAIYDSAGNPALVSNLSEILHGIQDEALDEGFPPDAFDAAELEAVDRFVETMAALAMMEEQEEKCRASFIHIKKRWEARRAQGLVNRPKPPRHVVDPVKHESPSPRTTTSAKHIIPYSHHQAKTAQHQQQQHYNDKQRGILVPKKMTTQRPKVIQQPRKHY